MFRCKDINSSGILSGLKHRLPATEQFDCNISTMLTRKCTNEVVNHPEIYKSFHKKACFDYIDLEKNPYYKMEFRVLRIPISEDTYECVITNLPSIEIQCRRNKKTICNEVGHRDFFQRTEVCGWINKLSFKKERVYNSGDMGKTYLI